MLTQKAVLEPLYRSLLATDLAHFTVLSGTKVQILTQKAVLEPLYRSLLATDLAGVVDSGPAVLQHLLGMISGPEAIALDACVAVCGRVLSRLLHTLTYADVR
jgi:hypothetical protein